MSYNPVNWVNGETPINDKNLNNMEKGIADAHSMLADHEQKINDFANQQLPEEYVKEAVDTYVENNSAGFATGADLAETKTQLEKVNTEVGKLSSEIADEINNRNFAISSAVDAEKARAMKRENEIEELFTTPTAEAIDRWLNEHPEATTTVQDKSLTFDKMVIGALGYVTPELFGAKGDGLTDDSKAIQQALLTGYPVLFANKTYLCKDIITKNVENVVLRGNGETVIKWNITSTENLRDFAGMISDDNLENTSYLGKGNVCIENIIFDGNGNNITDFPVTNSFGLCVFLGRENVTVKNCTFRNCHCDGLMVFGLLDKINVSNCTFENIGLWQLADGTRNGMTLHRNYYDRGVGKSISHDNEIVGIVENCSFYNIADECCRVDGFTAFSLNNCYLKNIGQHILETGHTSDKTEYVFEIKNCVGENISHSIYTSGSDGGGVFEYKGYIHIINSIFKNMCWTGNTAKYTREPNAVLISGYTSGVKPDILVDNCYFNSLTESDKLVSQPTMYMFVGENISIKNSVVNYEYVNVGNILPCFGSVSVRDCDITIKNMKPTFMVATFNDGGNITFANTAINKEDLYTFVKCENNNISILLDKCTFNSGGYLNTNVSKEVTGLKLRVIESIFNGKLTGRFLQATEGATADIIYFVGNYFPSGFCAWGTLSNITGSLDVKKDNSSMNS